MAAVQIGAWFFVVLTQIWCIRRLFGAFVNDDQQADRQG
jgi:hypothetical protein